MQARPVQQPDIHAPQTGNIVLLDTITVQGTSPVISPSPDGLVGAWIDRQGIEGLPLTSRVEDIVKRLPGVTTGGGPGEDKDGRVLGIDKEFTRTTVDGLPLPDSGEKREFNLDRLPNTFVESVKVYRLRRAEMDADGLAGRIDVKLRSVPHHRTIDVIGSYGGLNGLRNDAHLASVVYGDRYTPEFGTLFAGSHSRLPGTKIKDKFAPTGKLSEREDERKPVDATDLFMDFGFFPGVAEYHLRPKFFELDENRTKRKDKFTSSGASNGYETEAEHKVKRTWGGAFDGKTTLDSFYNAIVDGRVAYFETTEDKKNKTKYVFRANGTEDTAKREWEKEDKSDRVTQVEGNIALPLDGHWSPHTPKTGLLVRDRGRERDKTKIVGVTPSVDPKEDYQIGERIYAAYVQDTIRVGSWLTVTPGVRFETAQLDVTAGSGRNRSSSNQDFLPSIPIEIRFNENLSLHTGMSRLLNRPKFDELAPYENETTDKIVIGNPDLRPAKAWAYEAYLQHKQQYFSVGAGWSYRDVKDVIEATATGEVRNGKTVEQVQNVGDGWVRAYILEQRIDFSFLPVPVLDGISVTANQTFTSSRLSINSGGARRFKDQPPWFANLIVDWRNAESGTAVSVGTNFTSPFVNEDNGDRRGFEAYLDAKVTQRLTEHVNAFVVGQNLTDQTRSKYKLNGEIEMESTGRLVKAGLQGKF